MGYEEALWFIFLGLLGGFAYVLMEQAGEWEDLIAFPAFKRYALGAIVGLVYFIGYSERNFPNGVMCFVSGYAGTSFIQSLINRLSNSRKTN